MEQWVPKSSLPIRLAFAIFSEIPELTTTVGFGVGDCLSFIPLVSAVPMVIQPTSSASR